MKKTNQEQYTDYFGDPKDIEDYLEFAQLHNEPLDGPKDMRWLIGAMVLGFVVGFMIGRVIMAMLT